MEGKEKIIELFEHFERLKNTPRLGFTYFGIKHPESVAEHSFMVAFIALILALLHRENGKDIDVEKVLSMAILHEMGEVLIGDLHRMTRKYIGNEVVEDAEFKAARDLLSLLPDEINKKLENIYGEFMKKSSKEARVVLSADKLELLLYAYLLEKWGYGNLDNFFAYPGNKELIKDEYARELLQIIFEKRRNK